MERILSSRRFHKVLHELSEKEPDFTAETLRNELVVAIEDYEKRFNTFAKMQLELSSQPSESGELTMTIPNGQFEYELGESDEVDIVGARLKVLSIVTLMGLLECKNCKAEVIGVIQVALSEYSRFFSDAPNDQLRTAGAVMISRVGLYSPSVLISSLTGLYGQSVTGGVSMRAQSYPITRYDALASWFDQHHQVKAVALDDRNGVFTAKVHFCNDALAAHKLLLKESRKP